MIYIMRSLRQRIKQLSNHKGIWSIALIVFIFSSIAFSQANEYSFKALFLEAAIRFITWPSTSNQSTEDVGISFFTIGVFSNDKMKPHLIKIFSGKSVKNKMVAFRTIDSLANILECDMLFIPESEKNNIAGIIAKCNERPTLTVSDYSDFISSGLMLLLSIKSSKISCTINESQLLKDNFKISHHLLQKSNLIKANPEK